jgi:hypothetical protein
MNNLELNIPLSIFISGAALFLLAPSGLFSSFSANEIHKIALMIESIGITTAFIVFCRDTITFE